MVAPVGAPGSRLNVSLWAGRSASVAEAVNDKRFSSSIVLLPIAANSGAVFTSVTVIRMVSEALETGEPLSVTRTVTRFVLGPCALVGVQEKTPVDGLMLAPVGAPGSRLYVKV